MKIQSISYADEEGTSLRVATDRGEISVPWPCGTWHREPIDEWLAAGNAIAAYEAPPEPPATPDLAEALATALVDKGILAESDLPSRLRARIDRLGKR